MIQKNPIPAGISSNKNGNNFFSLTLLHFRQTHCFISLRQPSQLLMTCLRATHRQRSSVALLLPLPGTTFIA